MSVEYVSSQDYIPDYLDEPRDVKKKSSGSASELSASMGETTPENENDMDIPLKRHSDTVDSSNGWIDVLGNGLLLKKIIKNGEGVSTRPSHQSRVKMRVRGMLSNGTTIDKHNSLLFTIGDNDTIQAIDLVVKLMERSEVCQIKTDARYAYGATGRSPDVPPNSTLMYELELLEIIPPLDLSTTSEKELLNYLNKKRGRGNDFFQRKEFSYAVVSYGRAVEMIRNYKEQQKIDELSPDVSDLWIRCLNNLAAAQLKVESYDEALSSAQEVLKSDPDNVKALYRCGKVYLIKGDLNEAVENLQKASNLSPEEKAIHAELVKAIRKRDQHRVEEKALYKRMMDGSRTKPSNVTNNSPSSSSNSTSWKTLMLGAGLIALLAIGVAVISKYKK